MGKASDFRYNTGATTLNADAMKGADVTTNSQKMKALANFGFVPTERTFADCDYYTYLPTKKGRGLLLRHRV